MKQVLIINAALTMSPGKVAAQAAHAAIGAFERASKKAIATWQEYGVTKIVLAAKDEEHLIELAQRAAVYGLPHFLVVDAGRTEIEPGSVTALGIGPAEDPRINQITAQLRLL